MPSLGYLLPILLNGPGNQIVGFKEIAVLAKELNRTLILPAFHPHKSKISEPFSTYFDPKSVSCFTPYITAEKLGQPLLVDGIAFAGDQHVAQMREGKTHLQYTSYIAVEEKALNLIFTAGKAPRGHHFLIF